MSKYSTFTFLIPLTSLKQEQPLEVIASVRFSTQYVLAVIIIPFFACAVILFTALFSTQPGNRSRIYFCSILSADV